MYIVTSKSKKLKIDFDPQVYGLDTNPFGKEVPYKGIKFNHHTYTTENENLVERLRMHPNYVESAKQASRGSFWIESSQQTREMLSAQGVIKITNNSYDLKVEDKEKLKYLDKYSSDIPSNREILLNTLQEVIELFGISGIRVPSIKAKSTHISLVCLEVLDLLEESGIWPEPKSVDVVKLEEDLEEDVFEPAIETKVEVKNVRKRSNSKGTSRNG